MVCFCFSLHCRLKLACNHDITLHLHQTILLARLQAVIHTTASDAASTDTDQPCHRLPQRSIRLGVHMSEVHYVCFLLIFLYRFLDKGKLKGCHRVLRRL